LRITTHTHDELVICCPSSAHWLGRAIMGAGGFLVVLALAAILDAVFTGRKPDASWIGAGVVGGGGLLLFAAGSKGAQQAQDLVLRFDGEACCLRVTGPKAAERQMALADILGAEVYGGSMTSTGYACVSGRGSPSSYRTC
jgi:hypothetical protein